MRFDYNGSFEEEWANRPEMERLLERYGDAVADEARSKAPRDSGAGASSIHTETLHNKGSWEARVSWDRDHFYMLFQEVGTVNQPPRPFLRPAIEREYNL